MREVKRAPRRTSGMLGFSGLFGFSFLLLNLFGYKTHFCSLCRTLGAVFLPKKTY